MKRQIWQFACVAGTLMAAPFIYTLLLAPLIWLFPAEAPAVLGGLLTCLGLLLFFVSLVFVTVPAYLAWSGIALALLLIALAGCVVAYRRNSLRRKRTLVVAIALFATLARPVLVPYRPLVESRADVQLQTVDTPDFIHGTVRFYQAAGEGRGCYYEALGWRDDVTLVFRKWCNGDFENGGRTWNAKEPEPAMAYDVITQHLQPFDGDSESLIQKPCRYDACVRPLLETDYQHFSPGVRHYPGEDLERALLSPDGKWVAFVTEHVYGPQDLMVASTR